jgi:hypothetical protein
VNRRIWISVIASFVSFGSACFAQETTDPAALLQQLQEPATTDKAHDSLLGNAKLDSQTRKYLCANLPNIIEKGPNRAGHPWENAALLAGQLKIVEAAAALAKWIRLDYFADDFTQAQIQRLETNPAAKALSLIGDPAIPALNGVLERGTPHERFYAYLALTDIDTPNARVAIRARLDKETDVKLRNLILKATT